MPCMGKITAIPFTAKSIQRKRKWTACVRLSLQAQRGVLDLISPGRQADKPQHNRPGWSTH
jgi:hypothetical protein